jgi:hypothetical protein
MTSKYNLYIPPTELNDWIHLESNDQTMLDLLSQGLDIHDVNNNAQTNRKEYVLNISGDAIIDCTMDELRQILIDAIDNGEFDVLHLDDFSGVARMYRTTKKGLGNNVVKPFVCKRRQRTKALAVPVTQRHIVKHIPEGTGTGKLVIAAIVFFMFMGIIVLASRNNGSETNSRTKSRTRPLK